MAVLRGPMTPQDSAATIEKLREKGLNPSKVVSCVPSAGTPGAVRGVRGCNVEDRCPFHLTRYGGFKGQEPRTVGYYLKVNDGTNHQKEDEIACYKFVALLMGRMRAGQRDREEGKRGNPGPELINIVAWEPGTFVGQTEEQSTIRVKIAVPVNPEDRTFQAVWKNEVKRVPVHAYQHPSDQQGDSYEAELERAAMAREASDPDMQYGPPEMPDPSVRMPLEDGEKDELWEMANAPTETESEPEPVAPSGKKGKT